MAKYKVLIKPSAVKEIEKIAQAILNQQTEYKGIKLPKGQRCGTHYQQKSYALIKARELFEKLMIEFNNQ